VKNRTRFARLLLPLFALSAALAPSVTHADWPMFRRNAARNATASAAANLERPVRAWSYYLGGRVDSDDFIAADVNADSTPEIVINTGGRIVVKRPDDSILWETGSYGLTRLVAVEDVNGDREPEVIAVGYPAIIAVFNGRDGRLVWRTASDTFGPALGAVRMADFNGDGMRDIYVAEGNCGSVGQRGDFAYAYTFGRGFGSGVEDMSTRLWQLERGRDYVCGYYDAIADMTDDGRPDILAYSSDRVWLFDGTTGQKIPSGDMALQNGYPLGFSLPYGSFSSDPVDLDGDRRTELVGYTNNNYAPAINSRTVFVLDYDPARPQAQRLRVRWRSGVPSLANDTHRFVDYGAVDLDRDGRAEVTSTFDVQGMGPSTLIRRSSDGTVVARINGATIAGIIDTGPGLPLTILVKRGTSLEGYRFTTFAGAPMGGFVATTPAFVIANADVVNFSNISRRQRGYADSSIVSVPEADGTHRALIVSTNSGQRIVSYNIREEGAAVRLNELDLGAGLTVGAVQPQQNLSAMGEGLLLSRSDGVMVVLDRQLAPRNLGTSEVPLPGVRFGGYYSGGCGSFAAPVASRLDGRGDSILMVNSQRELLRLDAATATRVRPPEVAWRWAGAAAPNIIDVDGDGAKDIVAVTDTRLSGQFGTVNARRADGTSSIFSRFIPDTSTESVYGDVVPLAGPGGVRLSVVAANSGDGNSRAYVFSARGDRLFATPPTRFAGSGLGYISAYDITGDMRDDFMFEQAAVLYLVNGDSGAALGQGLATYPQMNVITAGRAGATQFITGGAYARVEGIRLDRDAMMNYVPAAQWSWSNTTYPLGSPSNCFGAVVQCPDGLRYAQAVSTSPRVVVTNATTGAIVFDVPLAQGRAFESEIELRASVPAPGLLTNVNATPSITGAATMTPAFVVGSSEGYLYALDACSATPNVRWAMNFRAPVGEAIFADTDADGTDEIIVSSADGFLHGIDTETFPAPSFVHDTDPPRVPAMDVDERVGTSLEAVWAPVMGATAYEWALFTASGSPVSRGVRPEDGPFIRTTNTTAFWNEGLVDGTRYLFAVRAIGAGGVASVETLSDGVRFVRGSTVADAGSDASDDASVTDTGAPSDAGSDAGATADAASMDAANDAGGGSSAGGCGCRVPARSAPNAPAAALTVLAALAAIATARSRRRA
jgi:hypothetical protein